MSANRARRSGRVRGIRPEEVWARAVISNALTARVEHHDDGSRAGMHDLDVFDSQGRIGAVEVTAAADSRLIELWKLVNPPGERLILPGLRGGWMITLDPSVDVRRLRAHLVVVLRMLEASSVRLLRPEWHRDGPFEAIARHLQIVQAHQSDTEFEGSVYFTVELPDEQSGGYVAETSDAVSQWVGDFLRQSGQADVLAKLARAGAPERHAFVLVPGFTTAPFAVSDPLMRDDAPVPTEPPLVPDPVTDVWVMSTWSSGVCFRWSPGQGWESFPKTV